MREWHGTLDEGMQRRVIGDWRVEGLVEGQGKAATVMERIFAERDVMRRGELALAAHGGA